MLRPLSWVYAGATVLRAAAYRRGWRATHRLGAPVISVGNLTAGGSGKTPVTEWLLRAAKAQRVRAAVLSRGYGRQGQADLIRLRGSNLEAVDPAAVGDEPYWLAERHPDVPIYLGRVRAAAGRLAEKMDAPGLFILDDGYQHLGVARSLNLLLADASRGVGGGRVLPSGWLREPLRAAARADAVIVTGCSDEADAAAVEAKLRPYLRTGVPVFRFGYRPKGLVRLDGAESRPADSLRGARVSVFCGIAQPSAFAGTLASLGAEVSAFSAFPDHEPYAAARLAELEGASAPGPVSAGEPQWVTTEKDAVKLRGRIAHPERFWVLEMEVAPGADWERYFGEWLAANCQGTVEPGRDLA